MKRHFLLAVSIAALGVFCSCSRGNRSVETRRAFAIRFNQERLASTRSAIEARWCKQILSALESADPKAIHKPNVASALLVVGKERKYALFVFWIESHPSVESVEFRVSAETHPIIIPIPEQELKQIRAEEKDTIVFGSEYDWSQESELWKILEQIVTPTNLQVRLLRGKAPVTDWYPVEFYKSGTWLSENGTNRQSRTARGAVGVAIESGGGANGSFTLPVIRGLH